MKNAFRKHVPVRLVWLLILLTPLGVGCRGCSDSTTSDGPDASGGPSTADRPRADVKWREDLLQYAVDNLNRLEDFNTGNMLSQLVERLNRLATEKSSTLVGSEPLLQSWPRPEMLRQIVIRLNQWIEDQPAPAEWKPDPLLETLPGSLAELPMVEDLSTMEFSHYDGFVLREAVWLRDISFWARGERLDDVQRAKHLFDWTVRNIQVEATQIEASSSGWIPQLPWETIWYGRGTAMERAWVFILLCRQQELDAAILALADPDDPAAPPSPWTVGVRSEGQLYLFDPALGLPIPAPDGVQLGEDGSLEIHPATLAEVLADETLLRRLDLKGGAAYPIKQADLEHLVVLVEASPSYLSARMELLQSQLVREEKMVLSTSASAQASRFRAMAGVGDVRVWLFPLQTLRHRLDLDSTGFRRRLGAMLPFYASPTAPLRKGRLLHLKGEFTGEQGATKQYQDARPPNRVLRSSEMQVIERAARIQAKQDASYWLGLIAQQRKDYKTAIDYFARRTLESWAGGSWTRGARYNLARTYEMSGQHEKAILQYHANPKSPGHHGNRLRAGWLKAHHPELQSTLPEVPEEAEEPKIPEPEIVE